MRLFPRQFERPLYSLLNDLAQLLTGSAELVSRTLGQPARDRSRALPALHENATRATELTGRIGNRLAESLITPFEAEVLYELALSMGDAVDAMERIAELTVSFRLGRISTSMLEAAQVLERACDLTVEACWGLPAVAQLGAYHRELRRLRRHGTRLVEQSIAELYSTGGAAADLLRGRDVAQAMLDALALLDRAGRQADLLRIKDT
ncbi:DUF47 domain-containing protein [Brachybacterium hainanense]|uniref:DUF47 domain-containing protein n=1 Tax=Brachybacterium hainanense TaxID=1541174 RepID=A0ABV6RDQ9_9MICO